ncbi:MAG: hypothetical protein P4L53_06910 [Candidatus Obscuribacterales bacterium]|nr:hypothetical protein [Candidatus Obscuribacterales bacterium]
MRVMLCSIAAISLLMTCPNVAPVFAQGMGGFGGIGGSPGMGGMGGGGMAGGGGGQQQQNQPSAEKEKPTFPPDDPAVQAATPPTSDAKLLTKVGWCEVQVFGHTFSDAGLTEASLPAAHMHLSERLQQLNQKLNFKPGMKSIKLMDNVDELVTFARDNAKKPSKEVAAAKAAK